MLERLRSATRPAHEHLEAGLALLQPPLSRRRFAASLAGFRTFHAAWEPQVEALIGDPGLLAPRRKLALLDQDLAALGARDDAAPAGFDLDFLVTASSAWGSLYVLEGAALGGQVISRALRQAPWAPAAGLSYFNPYGRRTGAMWAAFGAALEQASPGLVVDGVVAGALATFATLTAGLVPPLERAA